MNICFENGLSVVGAKRVRLSLKRRLGRQVRELFELGRRHRRDFWCG